MKHVKKSVLLWYSAPEIYELVIDVESYPRFLPWCSRAEVLQRDEQGLTARLDLSYSGLRQSFTTRNVHVPDSSVQIGLVDGPFSLLEGLWKFVPLAVPGASTDPASQVSPTACRIEFELRYAFANGLLDAAISPVFDRIANTLVDAFVKRAEQVHGAR